MIAAGGCHPLASAAHHAPEGTMTPDQELDAAEAAVAAALEQYTRALRALAAIGDDGERALAEAAAAAALHPALGSTAAEDLPQQPWMAQQPATDG